VVPLANPEFPGISVPGAVTVVIVPLTAGAGQALPVPAPDLKEAVARHLEDMRPVTAEVYVDGPAYRLVKVIARVEVLPSASPDAASLAVTSALTEFLSPLPVVRSDGTSSTPRGFGEDFYPASLYRAILDVADVIAVPILRVWVDGVEADLSGAVALEPNELLALATDPGSELTVVPRPGGVA
jgi:hypothetical protein